MPESHADSNAGLVRRHLLRGEAAKARFIGLYQPAASLEEAAELADHHLHELPLPIDVLVLGMGDDGHTASLFPNSPGLDLAMDPRGTRRCLPMWAPSVPHQRLTLPRAVLAAAKVQLLAIQGQSKLATLNAALAVEDERRMPVRAFLRAPLTIHWYP
ncbi:6-phosphogluconolactonase [Pseudomonas aeruginosa]|nr:6-phosphogluconolactonase [Pseudomonas aeruginosa]